MYFERDLLLEQHESNISKLIERIYFIHFTLSFIVALLSFNRTAFEKSTESMVITAYIVTSVFAIGVLLFSKYYVKKKESKFLLLLFINTLYFWVMNFAEVDKFFVTVSATVCGFFFLIYFMQRIKYVLLFSISPLLVVLYYIFFSPFHEIKVGQAFYILVLFTYIVIVYLSIEGIRLNNWYVSQLEERVKLTLEQNQELVALNEEYIATEEVLKDQYDELASLNTHIRIALKKMDILFDITNDGLIEVDLQTKKLTFNKMSEKLFHFSETLILSLEQISSYLTNDDFLKLQDAYFKVVDGVLKVSEVEVIFNYNQEKSYLRFTITKYTEDQREYVIVAVKNITTEKDHEAYLNELAFHDTLTDLPNKLALLSHLDDLIATNNTDFHIAIIDIQDMKNINHMFGFSIGDDLIKSVSKRLVAEIADRYYLARTGGDEFTIVCPNTIELINIYALIDMVFDTLENDFIKYKINFNMGVAYFIDNKTSMNWFENAEMAMYQAKENLLSHYSVYDHSYRQISEKRLMISYELEKALKENELTLNFQPEVHLETQKIVAFESLIRWNSPTLGKVAPSEFIPIAEHTGFILKLGDFIVRESCKFAKEVIKRNDKIITSINISGIQLLDKNFERHFLAIIDSYQVPRGNIAVEITETAVIENLDEAQKILLHLKNEGIHIFLDDFGTGYSSLLYLNVLPIDTLKIDKSFIDPICFEVKNRQLVETVIKLSKDMDMRVVAEGVETIDQIHVLSKCNCDVVQGYYFYEPLSFEEAIQLC